MINERKNTPWTRLAYVQNFLTTRVLLFPCRVQIDGRELSPLTLLKVV